MYNTFSLIIDRLRMLYTVLIWYQYRREWIEEWMWKIINTKLYTVWKKRRRYIKHDVYIYIVLIAKHFYAIFLASILYKYLDKYLDKYSQSTDLPFIFHDVTSQRNRSVLDNNIGDGIRKLFLRCRLLEQRRFRIVRKQRRRERGSS